MKFVIIVVMSVLASAVGVYLADALFLLTH